MRPDNFGRHPSRKCGGKCAHGSYAACMCVSICVCACERDSLRGKERARERVRTHACVTTTNTNPQHEAGMDARASFGKRGHYAMVAEAMQGGWPCHSGNEACGWEGPHRQRKGAAVPPNRSRRGACSRRHCCRLLRSSSTHAADQARWSDDHASASPWPWPLLCTALRL